MIMRDLTLRSAASFGSFHLLNLLFNEYLLYSIEKRLDDHRRSVGFMSFWPTSSALSTSTNEVCGEKTEMIDHQSIPALLYANSTTVNNQQFPIGNLQQQQPQPEQNNQNFAFDDFFRKSAVLGPTSSPVVNNRNNFTNNVINSNNNNAYLSSPLGTKTQIIMSINSPPNKENNANNISQNGNNDYNLI
jgi:hypothetical protein